MPPRTTQKSHRPRVSDRTMVGNCHPLLASAKDAAGRTRKNMTPRTSHKGEKQNHALEKCIAAANRGWMSEKYLPPAGQEKCFFLTSPFIEPAEPGFDGIRYFSTRVAQYVNDPNPAANYVFPVKVSKPIGFCDQLSKKILLSRPLSWQILQSISFTFKEPIPKVPIWPLKINADVEVPYWQTEFWNCEAKIRSLPCDSVQTV